MATETLRSKIDEWRNDDLSTDALRDNIDAWRNDALPTGGGSSSGSSSSGRAGGAEYDTGGGLGTPTYELRKRIAEWKEGGLSDAELQDRIDEWRNRNDGLRGGETADNGLSGDGSSSIGGGSSSGSSSSGGSATGSKSGWPTELDVHDSTDRTYEFVGEFNDAGRPVFDDGSSLQGVDLGRKQALSPGEFLQPGNDAILASSTGDSVDISNTTGHKVKVHVEDDGSLTIPHEAFKLRKDGLSSLTVDYAGQNAGIRVTGDPVRLEGDPVNFSSGSSSSGAGSSSGSSSTGVGSSSGSSSTGGSSSSPSPGGGGSAVSDAQDILEDALSDALPTGGRSSAGGGGGGAGGLLSSLSLPMLAVGGLGVWWVVSNGGGSS